MEFKAFLIKYAEIGVKGKNRFRFEDALIQQMRYALQPVGEFSIRKESGRIFVIMTRRWKHCPGYSASPASARSWWKRIKILTISRRWSVITWESGMRTAHFPSR